MTVEEAEALAKQGNVNAMMALGDYFSKKENDDYDIDRALHYYELAANAGELQAILEMARTFRYRADVMFSFYESAGKRSSNDADIEKAYYWAKKFSEDVQSQNVGDSTVEFAENNLMVAISRLATLYYMDEKYDDIVRITRGIKHPYAQSIYGYALYKLANTAQEMKDAFNALKNAENDLCWEKEYQTKYSQLLIVEAALYLSALFRTIYNDVDSSYRVMSCIATHSIDESIRQSVQADMAKKFKKKLFGGYTYAD